MLNGNFLVLSHTGLIIIIMRITITHLAIKQYSPMKHLGCQKHKLGEHYKLTANQLLLTFCLLLLPLWESVIVLCFVVRYFMSILVLQSS